MSTGFCPLSFQGERVWVRRMAEWEPIDRAAVKVMVQGVRGRLAKIAGRESDRWGRGLGGVAQEYEERRFGATG
jgi:hypothetical protein